MNRSTNGNVEHKQTATYTHEFSHVGTEKARTIVTAENIIFKGPKIKRAGTGENERQGPEIQSQELNNNNFNTKLVMDPALICKKRTARTRENNDQLFLQQRACI